MGGRGAPGSVFIWVPFGSLVQIGGGGSARSGHGVVGNLHSGAGVRQSGWGLVTRSRWYRDGVRLRGSLARGSLPPTQCLKQRRVAQRVERLSVGPRDRRDPYRTKRCGADFGYYALQGAHGVRSLPDPYGTGQGALRVVAGLVASWGRAPRIVAGLEASWGASRNC